MVNLPLPPLFHQVALDEGVHLITYYLGDQSPPILFKYTQWGWRYARVDAPDYVIQWANKWVKSVYGLTYDEVTHILRLDPSQIIPF